MLPRFIRPLAALFFAAMLPLSAMAQEALRTIRVTVLDAATAQPIPGATLAFRVGREPVKSQTGADGRAVLEIKIDARAIEQMLRFDVTVTAAGYSPRVIGWFSSAGKVLDTLPPGCEVKLTRGVTAGGVVQDAQGRPVAGARLELYGSDSKGGRLGGSVNQFQQDYAQVSVYGEQALVTDENGRWKMDDFPADLNQVTITVTRPGGARAFFMAGEAPDLAWQRGQRTDLGALKSARSTLALKDGFTVAGRVVDDAGRPLAGVTLRARDANARNQPHEFATDLEGRFELRNWDAAKVQISAERDGYRGTTVTVSTGADAAPATIVLQPGQPFRLRVLDGNGAPVAGAEIMPDPNPGAQILSWKATTDAEGRAVWNGAPDAPVKYWISSKTHGHRTALFSADGSEHVVRFRPGENLAVNVRLQVVDSVTGAPLPNVEIWRRMPRDPGARSWGEADQAGKFAKEIQKEEFTKGIVESYRLEARAEGYGTWGSDTLDFSNGDQNITVKLVKGGESRVPPPRRQFANGQTGDTNPALLQLATQVAKLLETGNSQAFADAFSATVADWQAVMPAGMDPAKAPNTRDNGRVVDRHKKAVMASAERVVALARQAGIAPGSVRFDVKSVTAPGNGRSVYRIDGREVPVSRISSINITLAGEPTGSGAAAARGDYQLVVGETHHLPAGLKTEQGIRWVALPAGLGDDALKAELRLVNAATGELIGEMRSLSSADDPALKAFGDAVAGLLGSGDVAAFVAKTGPANLGAKGSDLEKYEMELASAARALLSLPERIGVDFPRATVTVQRVLASGVRGGEYGSLDGMSARPLQVVLNVEGDVRGSGRYTVEFNNAARRKNQWLLANPKVRWQQIPEGLLASQDKETLALENYVAEHDSLPPGHVAPEIELVRLADDSRVSLSSYRGKFVILEFWATWCGPCQEPMAKLQQLYQEHPEWKDRVEFVTVSIDSKAAKALAHLNDKQWTKTTNFWAGPGEFKSTPALAYRVSGIPSSYVIGPDGKILAADHPATIDFATLLKTAAPVTGSGPE